jgi:hypothetical protein
MWALLISTLFFIFQPCVSLAENSFFASAYNQVRNGRTCGQVTRSDLKKAGFTCGFGNPIDEISISSWEIFEWNVFQLGAESQIDKNDCLTEQITALMKDEKLLKTWFSQLTAAWMGMKKSELILEKCQSEVTKRASPENIRQYGYKKAYEMSNNPLGKEWDAMCFDNDKINALKAARSLFPFALPVVSNPEFFKIMEKHRKMIVNKKTGKPLTDEELLKADLQDLSFMKLKLETNFENDMKDSLSKLSSERTSITKQIKDSKTDGSYRLSDNIKDYIFQDETIYQTLSEKNLMAADYAGLDKTKSDDPKIGIEDPSKVPVSNGAFCILAKYEPTLTGEIIDFAATSVIAGGVIFKALKGTKYLADLSKAGQVKKSLGYGLALNGYPMMAKQVFNSCGGNDAHTAKKVVSASKSEVLASIQASNLPSEVGYGTWNLEVDPKQTPSCKKAEDKNLMLNKKYKSNCFLDSLLAVSPLKISLPVILGVAVSN